MLLTVDKEKAGRRLDAFIADTSDISRSLAVKLIDGGQVFVNGQTVQKKYAVREGDTVELDIPAPKEIEALPENIPIDIVYEDGDIIIVNKASGMVVHPSDTTPEHTLVNALLYHCADTLSGINGALRPGIVHRIDKDTSGLLVVAKNDSAHRHLAAELETHSIVREYHALVHGGFDNDTGTVNLPIARSPKDRKKMAVVAGGREAITHYEVLERFGKITYIKLILETGRTHQIRVHMSHMGHPLVGDTVYGTCKTRFEQEHAALLDGQCLHAKKLTLTHPSSGERMTFTTDLPDNFNKLLLILREQ